MTVIDQRWVLPWQRSQSGARSTDVRRLGPRKPVFGQRLLGPIVVLLLWMLASGVGWLNPEKLAAPWTLFSTAHMLIATGQLQTNLLASLQRAGIGLLLGVVAGVVLAVAAGLPRLGDAMLDGLVQIKRSIPSVALIPLAIIWIGIGESMKDIIIALAVFIPIYINTHAALRGLDRRYIELGETVGLSRIDFLRKIVLPAALPAFLTGLRLAVTAAWTALVVVEQVNATSGIGYMMSQAQIYGETNVVLVGIIVYGLLGFLSDTIVRVIERKVLAWRPPLAR